jgi:hypothetical protein
VLVVHASRAFVHAPALRRSRAVPRANPATATAHPSSSPCGSPRGRGRGALLLWRCRD